jgi:sulfoxide reductase heme-binding subunit YedZ
MSRYWAQRIKRHLWLALLAFAIVSLAYTATPPPDVRHRASMATAYAGLVFLCWSLWLGPWNVLRRRPNPVSFDLRRDIGIWAGLLAVLHTVVGLTVHLRGRMWMYFFKTLHPLALQNTQFGFANYTGLVAALLFCMLLVLSNDASLRWLRRRRWKSLQRWSYAAFVLTAAHGIAYQLVEKRRWPWVLVFAGLLTGATALQISGFLRVRRISRNRSLKSEIIDPNPKNKYTS